MQLLALIVSSTDNLMQQRQPFWLQPGGGKSYAGDIIAGLRERVGNLQHTPIIETRRLGAAARNLEPAR